MGVEQTNLMILNDLRWTPEMIPWSEFLKFLEDQTVHFAAPKTDFARGIMLSLDISIFATSIEMAQFLGKSNHVQGKIYDGCSMKGGLIQSSSSYQKTGKIKKVVLGAYQNSFSLG